IFAAGTLVSREELKAQIDHLVPDDPSTPKNDAPWASSPFLTALAKAGSSYNWVSNICIACFITSAASAASAEVFISARCLFFLAEAGHAPAFFGAVLPKKTEGVKDNRAVVPWVGVLATVGFATLSWLCVRPGDNAMSEMEKAWVGNLFTYLRFWKGTCHKKNRIKYKAEIERILENRAIGQPYLFCAVFPDDPEKFSRYQVLKFITTYLPIPVFMIVLFGYKLICQTEMISAEDMNFSGVAGMDLDEKEPEEKRPTTFWGRVWWILVK
ncbi:hypothetical protein FRC00_006574, partial [Tulasnella sp. 408]